VRLLTDLVRRDPWYLKLSPGIVATVAGYHASPNDETVSATYQFLCLYANPLPALPMATVANHIDKDEVYKDAYRYLARLPSFDPSPELLNAFFGRPTDSISWFLMAKAASSQAGVALFMSSPGWLENCTEYPREELRIFMILAAIPSLRSKLCKFQFYPALLKANVLTGEDQLLAAVPVIAGRCGVSEEVHRGLSAEGFWRPFLRRVKSSESIEVQHNCMTLLIIFSAVGWTDEFGDFIRYLVMLLASPVLAMNALRALSALSFLSKSAPVLIDIGMVAYFEKLRENSFWTHVAEQVLTNINQGALND
jgi:hypothetical protein